MGIARPRALVVFSHNRLTGVTTFSLTLAQWLSRTGYDVHAHVMFRESQMPLVEENLAALFPTTVGARLPTGPFDAVFVSDAKTLRHAGSPDGPVYAFAHGIGELEHEYEATDRPRFRHLYAVSPFMCRYYQARLGAECVSYLPNLIDTARFTATQPVGRTPRRALLNDRRRADEYIDLLRPVFAARGIELVAVGALNLGYPIWDMARFYSAFDWVIGCGRSAYEAMSCERNVLVLGVRAGDGVLNAERFPAAFERNCSGYGTRLLRFDDPAFTERINRELDLYASEAGPELRRLAIEHVDVERHAPTLLARIASAR